MVVVPGSLVLCMLLALSILPVWGFYSSLDECDLKTGSLRVFRITLFLKHFSLADSQICHCQGVDHLPFSIFFLWFHMKLLQWFPPNSLVSLSTDCSLIFAKRLFSSKWSGVLSERSGACFAQLPKSLHFLHQATSHAGRTTVDLSCSLTVSTFSNSLKVPLILYLNDLYTCFV